ncbi:MAG: hypothetical protein U0Y68_24260 [Blastocatellia bacterium]
MTARRQQADFCLTPNASFSFKALREYDPGNTGYVIAIARMRRGIPIQNNVLIGNAFVTTPTLRDNYTAEAFRANTPNVAIVNGNRATLQFDNTGYDTARRSSLSPKSKARLMPSDNKSSPLG